MEKSSENHGLCLKITESQASWSCSMATSCSQWRFSVQTRSTNDCSAVVWSSLFPGGSKDLFHSHCSNLSHRWYTGGLKKSSNDIDETVGDRGTTVPSGPPRDLQGFDRQVGIEIHNGELGQGFTKIGISKVGIKTTKNCKVGIWNQVRTGLTKEKRSWIYQQDWFSQHSAGSTSRHPSPRPSPSASCRLRKAAADAPWKQHISLYSMGKFSDSHWSPSPICWANCYANWESMWKKNLVRKSAIKTSPSVAGKPLQSLLLC